MPVGPLDRAAVDRLEQLAVGLEREELVVLVAHIVGPAHPVEGIAGGQHLFPQRNVHVEKVVEHVDAPRRVGDHGDQETLGAHHARVRDVKAEPQSGMEPCALRPQVCIRCLQPAPRDPVAARHHARLGLLPLVRALDAKVEPFRRRGDVLPVAQRGAPARGADHVFFRLFDHLLRELRAVVDPEPGKAVESEIVDVRHVLRHPLLPPALDRRAPRAVRDRDPVCFLVRVHAPHPLVRGHLGHRYPSSPSPRLPSGPGLLVHCRLPYRGLAAPP